MLFTHNQKTILSLDFDRDSTCLTICDYCYVANMERIYPAYLQKVSNNSLLLLADPTQFAENLNEEYRKARASKSKQMQDLAKLPVRIYGSGDYIREHLEVFKLLEFPFFIISKTLTETSYQEDLQKVLQIPNLTSVVLSFDHHNIANYSTVQSLYNQDKIKFSYTGLPDEFLIERDLNQLQFNIFFNIGNKKSEKEAAKEFTQRCPADSGDIPLQKACTKCHKCWASSRTRGEWNTLEKANVYNTN